MSSNEFLEKLRSKEAAPLTMKLKSFITASYQQRKAIGTQKRVTAAFINNMVQESISISSLFSDWNNEQGLLNLNEGWEKLVLTKLHDLVFGAPFTDESRMCAHFSKKIDLFSWVNDKHLDLPFVISPSLHLAKSELLRLENFRAPKDKLTILINAMQIVIDLIQKVADDDKKAGNDVLLPVLVLLLIQTALPSLISHIKYILRFRNPNELEKGFNQFCLTNMMSAISFIYTMTPESLTLTPLDKQAHTSNYTTENRQLILKPDIELIDSPTLSSDNLIEDEPPNLSFAAQGKNVVENVIQSTSVVFETMGQLVKNKVKNSSSLTPSEDSTDGKDENTWWNNLKRQTSLPNLKAAAENVFSSSPSSSESSPDRRRLFPQSLLRPLNNQSPRSSTSPAATKTKQDLEQEFIRQQEEVRERRRKEEEEFEMELAMALSISLQAKDDEIVDEADEENYVFDGAKYQDPESKPSEDDGTSDADNKIINNDGESTDDDTKQEVVEDPDSENVVDNNEVKETNDIQ